MRLYVRRYIKEFADVVRGKTNNRAYLAITVQNI